MKRTMLTYRTIDRAEKDFDFSGLNEKQEREIELSAYIANMNASQHQEWTEEDIYNEFLRVAKIGKAPLISK